jgi:hypothetical protein
MGEPADSPDPIGKLNTRNVHDEFLTSKYILRGPVLPIAIEREVRRIGSDHGRPTLWRDVCCAVTVASCYQYNLTHQGGRVPLRCGARQLQPSVFRGGCTNLARTNRAHLSHTVTTGDFRGISEMVVRG